MGTRIKQYRAFYSKNGVIMNFRFFITLLTIIGIMSGTKVTRAEENSSIYTCPRTDLKNINLKHLLRTCCSLCTSEDTSAFGNLYGLQNRYQDHKFNRLVENPDYIWSCRTDIWYMYYKMLYEKLDTMEGKHIELPIPNPENFIIKDIARNYIREIKHKLSYYDEITMPPFNTFVQNRISSYRHRITNFEYHDQCVALINTFSVQEVVLCLYEIVKEVLYMKKDKTISGDFTYEELYAATQEAVEREGNAKEKNLFKYLYRPDQIMVPCEGYLEGSDLKVYYPNKEIFLKHSPHINS